ncbi:adenosylcobinamide kinase/adenosylcobinamide-phosphate guanylyltransferase [Dyadobacter jejuensis]|uniref:Adenosylcobinamide kinase n=1 Tax=Dyadobacter jejuensis TaxID=1082580 RepID=A0A316ACQ8_9BACT|nr:bifunctional adenosylcobinamide kinase/adenosylcobinamide-phosphate guanylyltransferase [Dyadobacter jejuensis]PWJ55038.1 adenosylcobinamide kinase/adenosylcobinamide-phosphate guanylyltransferase [Dyadobacter jejuensis]
MLTYISGGARSGKSAYAQQLALMLSPNPVYVATAHIWDEDFALRVQRHREERGPEWSLMEREQGLDQLPLSNRVVVVDCVTLWLTNIFMSANEDPDKTLAQFKREVDGLLAQSATLIVISNELGMGLHADTTLGRRFVDLQGWANQYVAQRADRAILMVSGLPLQLKPSGASPSMNTLIP